MAYLKLLKAFTVIFLITVFHVQGISSSSLQPGVFDVVLSPNVTFQAEFKSLYGGTPVRITANPVNGTGKVRLSWELRYTQCEGLYGIELNQYPKYEEELFSNHAYMFSVENYINVAANQSSVIELQGSPESPPEVTFGNYSYITWSCYVSKDNEKLFPNCELGTYINQDDEHTQEQAGNNQGEENEHTQEQAGNNQGEENRAIEHLNSNSTEDTGSRKRRQAQMQKEGDVNKNVIARVQESGSYLLIIRLENIGKGKVDSFPVRIDMKGEHGYLSAFQYKLLPFYGIMCGLYMLMGFTWLFLMCYQYKDLLGIQIWIGVVILLGLIEKAVFFGEFEHMNNYGTQSALGILFPEIVSCIKRTLARLLVVVVSIGYGITRPRLGNDLNYIMAAGLTYLLLSSAEAIMRTSEDYERTMVAVLPLSILDAILVWWIFRNLVDTTRVLRLRQNDTKLWLYRHFTNTLLLCVLLSVIFFVWSMKTHSLNECIVKWEELWLDDAFWHILFCVILIVIMILFRPSVNNQRYAYSPLIDEEQEDEESKEPMLSEAYDGMKMRNLKKDNPQNAVMDIADDLKWVEDNIPAAIADTALTMMDDSEDELMANTERSKMD